MPVITIQGMPSNTKYLEQLITTLQEAAVKIPELGLTKNQVSVFIPADLVSKGLGEELIVRVTELIKKPPRTWEVMQQLANALKIELDRFTTSHVRNCRLIEVFVYDFDPEVGACAFQGRKS